MTTREPLVKEHPCVGAKTSHQITAGIRSSSPHVHSSRGIIPSHILFSFLPPFLHTAPPAMSAVSDLQLLCPRLRGRLSSSLRFPVSSLLPDFLLPSFWVHLYCFLLYLVRIYFFLHPRRKTGNRWGKLMMADIRGKIRNVHKSWAAPSGNHSFYGPATPISSMPS